MQLPEPAVSRRRVNFVAAATVGGSENNKI